MNKHLMEPVDKTGRAKDGSWTAGCRGRHWWLRRTSGAGALDQISRGRTKHREHAVGVERVARAGGAG
jgi:hypothetical protein